MLFVCIAHKINKNNTSIHQESFVVRTLSLSNTLTGFRIHYVYFSDSLSIFNVVYFVTLSLKHSLLIYLLTWVTLD